MKGDAGPPAITDKLVEFIESEFNRCGFINSMGDRCVVIAQPLNGIAVDLGVSKGTVKNGLAYLEKNGYIKAREQGMYLRLATTPISSKKGQVQGVAEPSEDDDSEEYDGPQRLTEPEITRIVRDLVKKRGAKDAQAFLRAHRMWCALNDLPPHL